MANEVKAVREKHKPRNMPKYNPPLETDIKQPTNAMNDLLRRLAIGHDNHNSSKRNTKDATTECWPCTVTCSELECKQQTDIRQNASRCCKAALLAACFGNEHKAGTNIDTRREMRPSSPPYCRLRHWMVCLLFTKLQMHSEEAQWKVLANHQTCPANRFEVGCVCAELLRQID